MKRDVFGNPRPEDGQEMITALDEWGGDMDAVYAEVAEVKKPAHDGFGNVGWVGEVMNAYDGDTIFISLAFPTREALVEALDGAGILDIQNR